MVKRFFDLVTSFLALLVLAPFFLLVMAIVKIDSTGPAFYLQQRVGRAGKVFRLYKFRTMQLNADRLTAITIGTRDPRITRVGYYLRKLKIDELPQLINVLKGDMSLVGPRPELKKFVDLYDDEQLQVLSVRPGITDPASIEFRNENELLEGKADPIRYYIDEIMPRKLRLNLEYLRNRSLAFDLKVIFLTIFSIFSRTK